MANFFSEDEDEFDSGKQNLNPAPDTFNPNTTRLHQYVYVTDSTGTIIAVEIRLNELDFPKESMFRPNNFKKSEAITGEILQKFPVVVLTNLVYQHFDSKLGIHGCRVTEASEILSSVGSGKPREYLRKSAEQLSSWKKTTQYVLLFGLTLCRAAEVLFNAYAVIAPFLSETHET